MFKNNPVFSRLNKMSYVPRLLSSMEIFKGEKWETLEHKLPIPVKAHCAVAIRY